MYEKSKEFSNTAKWRYRKRVFQKKPFNEYKSEYFSSERQFHLTSELEEMIANHNIDNYQQYKK